MSAPGYEIKDSVSLSAHAGKVAGVADGIREANTAGGQVGLGGVEAYGLLCSPLMIPALQVFQGDMDELLRSASDLAGGLSDGIKQTITDYDELERRLKAHYDSFGEPS
ncbi:hypothetical protein SAMN05192558_101219 [Actinokineospora alba]|uniref:Excreted virulence factor EspC, type VII ESX diderm n=1 Tax=Actinokineospora alba TaxID=504798 RepID=A0A1H0F3U1_9PSEU|nr:hypothetical protein [Actinokineospora alba]TDP69329.1 hypothetical protein C8E96_4915 [Actinokineospora alba]SDI19134.1 hypothetical protein SAMN05421871_103651 [Actinokineospora alba]SDN89320.1 hypothetical protein SAMN05192558_101219 [Actinokineospora alba]